MFVSIIFHTETLREQLRLLADRLQRGEGRHIRQGLIDAARYYMAAMRARFQRASRHDGTWKDHALSTKREKLRKHTPTSKAAPPDSSGMLFPILFDTGRLYESLSPGGPGYIERFAGPLSIFVGTAVPYAIYHQTGTTRMPQRTVLDFPNATTSR